MRIRSFDAAFFVLLFALLPAVIAGCDGLGPSDDSENDPERETVDGSLNAEQMVQTTQRINAKVDSVMPEGVPPEDREPLQELNDAAQAVASVSNVAGVKVEEKLLSATVMLENGLPIMINNSRPSEDGSSSNSHVPSQMVAAIDSGRADSERTPSGDVLPAPYEVARRASGTAREKGTANRSTGERGGKAATSNAALPESNRAVVVSIDGGQQQANRVQNWLGNAGYEISQLGGTLQDMRQYDDIGVLYLDTHGSGFLSPQDCSSVNEWLDDNDCVSMEYGLQTAGDVPLDTNWINAHEEELLSGDILLAKSADTTFNVAITDQFISKHWDLNNGFAFVHACFFGADPLTVGGVSYDPTEMQDEILESARSLVSFDHLTNTRFAQGSIYNLFQMLLGRASSQRAWPLGTVKSALEEMGLDQFQKPSAEFPGLPIQWGGNTVNVTYHGDENVILAPAIHRIDVTDDAAQQRGELEIHGQFGSSKGSVFVDQHELDVETWEADRIVARSPFTGDGSTGNVHIEGPEDRISNSVALTQWQGQIAGFVQYDAGTLQSEYNSIVRFRADVHRRADEPTEMPSYPDHVETYISPASHGRIVGTGSYYDDDDYPPITARWMGENDFRVLEVSEVEAGGPPAQTAVVEQDGHELDHDSFLGGKVRLDPGGNQAELCLRLFGKHTEEVEYHDPNVSTESWEIGFAIMDDLLEHAETSASAEGLTCTPLALPEPSTEMDIRGTSLETDSPQGDLTHIVTWSDFQAENPFSGF